MTTLLTRLKQEKAPLRFLMSRVLWKTGVCRALKIKQPGYQLKFFPSALSATLWVDPQYSAVDKSVLSDVLRPGDTYVDVGANIGDLLLHGAHLVGNKGRAFGIEAHPRTFSFLEQNVAINPSLASRCSLLNCGAGAVEGMLHFSDQLSDDQNRIVQKGIEIQVKPLDELLPHVLDVRLLKIDVEGFEKFVFEGARNLLQRTEFVYFEAFDRHSQAYGYKMEEVATMLRGLGFEVPEFNSLNCVNVLCRRIL